MAPFSLQLDIPLTDGLQDSQMVQKSLEWRPDIGESAEWEEKRAEETNMGNSNIYGSSRGGLPRRGWKGTARGMRTQRKEACTPKVVRSRRARPWGTWWEVEGESDSQWGGGNAFLAGRAKPKSAREESMEAAATKADQVHGCSTRRLVVKKMRCSGGNRCLSI